MQAIYLVSLILVIGIFVWFYSKKKREENGLSITTPFLDRYSRDLTKLAKEKKLDVLVGRKKEVERALQILSRRTKNNLILIGEAGVGKTAIAEGIATKIAKGKVPQLLKNKRMLALNLGGLLSGTKYRGEFEQRIENVTRELLAAKRSVILFIDEIQNLTQAGEAVGAVGAANLLKPFLARGELQVIGAVTPKDYFDYIQQDTSLERRFQPILIKEPNVEQTLKILKGLKKNYEEYHNVQIPDEILEMTVELTSKYLTDRYFPDKAIDLIDEAAAKVSLANMKVDAKEISYKKRPKVSVDDLRAVIFQWGSDVTKLKRRKEAIRNNIR